MTGHGKVKALYPEMKAKNEITSIKIEFNNGQDYVGIPSQDEVVGIIEMLLNYLDIGKISKIHFETASRLIEFQKRVSELIMSENQSSTTSQEEKL